MIRSLSIVPFLVVAGALAAPSEAHAQWGWGGYNGYNGVGVYSIYDQDRLPYFALHPPVYYSQPVPRTFGYSPFAYPGWVPTPALPTTVEPTMIINPFVNEVPAAVERSDVRPAPTPAPPASKGPTLRVGPLQGYQAPQRTPKALGKSPTSDKSAAVEAGGMKPLRIVNPHVDRRVVPASLQTSAE